jgi:hypothetical protein
MVSREIGLTSKQYKAEEFTFTAIKFNVLQAKSK